MRHDAKYFKFPMRESVQDWRNKWFYLKDEPTKDHPTSFPTFKDMLVAKPKKTRANTLSAEEEGVVEALYQRVQSIWIVRGQTSIGTEIAALFLR